MLRVGMLSDTHGYLHPKVSSFFAPCDEIWHAGDFGNLEVAVSLRAIKPLLGVSGNIDGPEIRHEFPLVQLFQRQQITVLMTHIGGRPGKYDKNLISQIKVHKPNILVCGHSHILKVMYDNRFNLLYINPGAAGKSGLHQVITFVRFVIDGTDIRDLEVMELPR
jgi:putative phosphoesterase